jgi:hypothetical protein
VTADRLCDSVQPVQKTAQRTGARLGISRYLQVSSDWHARCVVTGGKHGCVNA